MGQVPEGRMILVETLDQVDGLEVEDPENLAFVTQTTLSVEETAGIVEALRARFPSIQGPRKEDICYATTNRQAAVRTMAAGVDAVLVLGAPNSSNSRRLVETARDAGCARSVLVQRATDIDWSTLAGVKRLGITAGASAPEVLVEEVIEAARARYTVTVEDATIAEETITFKLPRALSA
jgi:4-hydroxy-3-methylbut-2-enyl diphosphate reductase